MMRSRCLSAGVRARLASTRDLRSTWRTRGVTGGREPKQMRGVFHAQTRAEMVALARRLLASLPDLTGVVLRSDSSVRFGLVVTRDGATLVEGDGPSYRMVTVERPDFVPDDLL